MRLMFPERVDNVHVASGLAANPARHPFDGLKGSLRTNEPMSKHSTWKTGGAADFYYVARARQDLQDFLSQAPTSMPVHCFGNGSNTLVRDGGIRGAIFAFASRIAPLRILQDARLEAGAGISCAKTARAAAECGLSGAEFLAGIPGSIGGALYMNAGAWGAAIWDLVEEAVLVDRQGRFTSKPRAEFQVSYRTSGLPEGQWFFSCRMSLRKSAPDAVCAKTDELLAERARCQPLDKPSCGSVFKNPLGDHAARLIDVCGLKGFRIGGACISEKHANFIINAGGASSADIERLIEHAQVEVLRIAGVRLQPEVRIIGESLP
ncbi:MAG: UDP-N-acetylmuramate dehydrogenase [Candidatus Eutrophobiaceae bacterium]